MSLGLIVAVVAVVVSTVSGVFRSDASLPVTSPDQIVAQVTRPHVGGYSGTISTHLDLDLPAVLGRRLPSAVPTDGALLRGSHQLKYWYGGASRQRVAVVGTQGREQDVFRNGDDLLFWDTRDRTAQRATASAPLPVMSLSMTTPATLTPPQLAAQLLAMSGGAGTAANVGSAATAGTAGDDGDGTVTLRSDGMV